jgi:multidrug resistance protein, MATE family
MVLIMAFNFLVGFTDIYVAGLINPEVQAAIGFIGQLFFLIVIIANAISIGTLAMVSRAFGAGDMEKTTDIARQSLLFSILAAIGLTVVGLFFSRAILTIAGIPEEIKDMAEKFFRIFAFALGPNYILIISNAIFRAVGDMKKPLFTMFFVSAINVIGDFVLVFGVFGFQGLGYIGIAISTAVSMTIGTVINLVFFTTGIWRGIYRRPWKISAEAVKKITALGWPAAVSFCIIYLEGSGTKASLQ